MNKVVNNKYLRGFVPIIYAADILFQENYINNAQLALNSLGSMAQKIGLVANEEKKL